MYTTDCAEPKAMNLIFKRIKVNLSEILISIKKIRSVFGSNEDHLGRPTAIHVNHLNVHKFEIISGSVRNRVQCKMLVCHFQLLGPLLSLKRGNYVAHRTFCVPKHASL